MNTAISLGYLSSFSLSHIVSHYLFDVIFILSRDCRNFLRFFGFSLQTWTENTVILCNHHKAYHRRYLFLLDLEFGANKSFVKSVNGISTVIAMMKATANTTIMIPKTVTK